MPNVATGFKFRISLAGVMGLVVVAAVISRWPVLGYLAISVASYAITYRVGPPARRWTHLGVLLGSIYVPCLFGFRTDCNHCRQAWLELFPITPTIGPTFLSLHFMGFGRLPDHVESWLSALTLGALLVSLAAIARRGRAWLIACAVFGFAWSCVFAWVFHELLRS